MNKRHSVLCTNPRRPFNYPLCNYQLITQSSKYLSLSARVCLAVPARSIPARTAQPTTTTTAAVLFLFSSGRYWEAGLLWSRCWWWFPMCGRLRGAHVAAARSAVENVERRKTTAASQLQPFRRKLLPRRSGAARNPSLPPRPPFEARLWVRPINITLLSTYTHTHTNSGLYNISVCQKKCPFVSA